MELEKKDPEQTAIELVDNNVTIETYQKVQNRRKERLAFWKERNLNPMLKNEQGMVDFGEMVLIEMKKRLS